MIITIDFNSTQALYMQLYNQIIMHIATAQIKEGDSLPSVRQMADEIGINMHTVNKAYSVLREEGYIKLDRRHGAVVAVDIDKLRTLQNLSEELRVIIAKAVCKNVTPDEIHTLVDGILEEYTI